MPNKCEYCDINYDYIISIKLKDRVLYLCPNCYSRLGYELVEYPNNSDFLKKLNLTINDIIGKDNEIDEVYGEPNAIVFNDGETKYRLRKDTFVNFITHNLTPIEYLSLLKHHNKNEYMLHDDFYSNNGFAYQPSTPRRIKF